MIRAMKRLARFWPRILTACWPCAMSWYRFSEALTGKNLRQPAASFLSAWNGTSGYTFDRVIRGVKHIDAACVSMIGTTQPGRMADYIRRASKENDDGMIQRFGVLSWPDASPDWKNVDRWPDSNARERAWATFERLASLDPDSVDAQSDKFDALRFLRLDPTAQAAFDEW